MPVAGLLHQMRHGHDDDFGFQYLVDKGKGEPVETTLSMRRINGMLCQWVLFNQLANIHGFVLEGGSQLRVNRLVVGGCGP